MDKTIRFRLAHNEDAVLIGNDDGTYFVFPRPEDTPDEAWLEFLRVKLFTPLAADETPTFTVREWGPIIKEDPTSNSGVIQIRELDITLQEIKDDIYGLSVEAAYDPLNERWFIPEDKLDYLY